MNLRTAATILSTAAIIAGVALAAPAAADELDPRITYALDAQPGGVVTSATTVVWPALGMELTLEPWLTGRGLSTKCPSGLICAFALAGEGGARLTWGSCGTFSTTALASVGSVANARSVGTVQARNGTTVVASTSAGNYVNVYSATDNIRCL